MTSEEQDAAYLALPKGLSYKQAAEALGTSMTTIGRIRKRLGIVRERPWKIPDETLKEIDELLKDGESIASIAEIVGWSKSAVRANFPGRGWTPAQKSAHMVKQRQANRRLY